MLVALKLRASRPDFEIMCFKQIATGELGRHSETGSMEWGEGVGIRRNTDTKHTLSTLMGCDVVATQGFIVSLEEEA